MKAILQRVLSASVTVDKEVVSAIGKGVLVFAAVAPGDTQKEADSLAAKVLKLKLWDDDEGGRWKKNVQEIGGEVLCGRFSPALVHFFRYSSSNGVVSVSQFTLLASTKKGNKPDFHGAAGGEEAKRLYQYFFEKVQQGYGPDKVRNGVFQAMMEVALVNDGPVTLEISALPKSGSKVEQSPSVSSN
ncbi:D-Tyr tRNAtyr deacylase-like domain-containing protein [Xylaria scruposa]|nr:D-Tyr tRNAtyr deacylase-like domain-containing protein [Xylaria scruposa]